MRSDASNHFGQDIRQCNTATYGIFGRRLERVMELAKLSNSRLAKELNVDPSLISRFRSGQRAPKANARLGEALSQFCYRQLVSQGKQKSLSSLCGIPDEELGEEAFGRWLCDYTTTSQQAARQIVEDISSYMPSPRSFPQPDEIMMDALFTESKSEYYGEDGIQRASLAFLATVIKEGGKEVLIYSDHPMDWLSGDPVFLKKWAVMMSAMLSKNVRVRVIHNIDRSSPEMNAALRNWMPLYMSGKIEPYYNRYTVGNRFYHTIFVCPGIVSIEGIVAQGQENGGRYHFTRDALRVADSEILFKGLMKNSKRLLRLTWPENENVEDLAPSDEKEILKGVFANICIKRRPDAVIVERLSNPRLCFWLYHPLMLQAFDELEKTIR